MEAMPSSGANWSRDLLDAFCQLRRGEVPGHQRQDEDTIQHGLAICRAVVLPSGAYPQVGPPKTDTGTRTVAMLEPAWSAMVDRPEQIGSLPGVWLFVVDDCPLHPGTVNRAWAVARGSIGCPDFCSHDLRHSRFATTSCCSAFGVVKPVGG